MAVIWIRPFTCKTTIPPLLQWHTPATPPAWNGVQWCKWCGVQIHAVQRASNTHRQDQRLSTWYLAHYAIIEWP